MEAIYTSTEAKSLGADPNCALMLEAKKGYCFLDDVKGELIRRTIPYEVKSTPNLNKATHGYLPFKQDYTTVFMVSGKGIKKGVIVDKMSILDEAPTMAKLLGIKLKDPDGRTIEEFFD